MYIRQRVLNTLIEYSLGEHHDWFVIYTYNK